MIMEGVVIRDCTTRNIPSLLGAPINNLVSGSNIRITNAEQKPDGTWYRIGTDGWLKAKDVEIKRDIEFMIKAKKMKLLDMNIISNNGISIGRTAGIALTSPGGCFGEPDRSVGGLESYGGIPGNTTIGGIANNFGINLGGGFLGKTLGNVTIDSLFDGTFFSSLLDSAIDAIFGSFFNRINAVVGFDVESLLGSFYGIFDAAGSLDDILSSLDNGGLEKIWSSAGFLFPGGSTWLEGVWNLLAKGSSVVPMGNADFIKSFMASVHYFDYLGCANGQVVEHPGTPTYWTDAQNLDFRTPILNHAEEETVDYSTGILEHSEDEGIDYSTPILESGKPDLDSVVKFNSDLYENIYDDFKESIDKVKSNVNLSISRLDWFINFNRYRTTHPDYHLTGSQGHVFMTRPALNIFDSAGSNINEEIKKTSDGAFFAEAIARHGTISRSLTKEFSGDHDFIPIIHNTARTIDIQDTSIDTQEYGETLTKWKVVYAKDVIKSLTSGTFSINYVDDSHLSISYLHLIWLYYMNGVSRGEYGPLQQYVKEGILDYASSCYYILTDITGENILFWSKYWGVFPTNYPSSAFSMRDSDMVKTPEVTIQYAYSFKRDMDPVILAEFNRNSLSGKNWEYIPIHSREEIGPYNTIVGPPFIDRYVEGSEGPTGEKNPNAGAVQYKLRFRKSLDENATNRSGFSSAGGTSMNSFVTQESIQAPDIMNAVMY